MEEGRNAFKILTCKSTGKRPLERPRRRWEDNIRIDLKEIGINTGNWVNSAQHRDYWRALVKAAGMEEGRSAFKILTGKLTGMRPLGRP